MYKNICKPFELVLILVIFSVIAAVPATTSSNDTTSEKPSGVSNSTEAKVSRIRNMWNIKNFNTLNLTLGQKLTSPTFSAKSEDECDWMLDFYPAGINQESKSYVALFISSSLCNANANVRISFLNAKREQVYKKEFFHDFANTKIIGFNSFVKRELLVNKKKNVLLNNTLTIFSEVNATLGEKQYLKKDLGLLLESRNFSNIILVVGGKEFQAHKGILAARSPVFRAMFETNMKKKKVSKVEIRDMTHETFKKLLGYIYTGEVSNLEHLTSNLLAAANKYKVNGLKTICENSMIANLKIENSAEFYLKAEKYSAVKLKNFAKDFIKAHASDVVQTPGFKLLVKMHPDFVADILTAASAHQSESH